MGAAWRGCQSPPHPALSPRLSWRLLRSRCLLDWRINLTMPHKVIMFVLDRIHNEFLLHIPEEEDIIRVWLEKVQDDLPWQQDYHVYQFSNRHRDRRLALASEDLTIVHDKASTARGGASDHRICANRMPQIFFHLFEHCNAKFATSFSTTRTCRPSMRCTLWATTCWNKTVP